MLSRPPTAGLSVRAVSGQTRAVALVLPGGRVRSHARSRPWHLSAVRMIPFARSLHLAGADHGLTVWTVRYRYRGWNGAEASPVEDVRWALDEVRSRSGHSAARARRTEAARLARERDEPLATAHAHETVTQQAAREELLELALDEARIAEPVLRAIACLVEQAREVVADNLVQHGGLGLAAGIRRRR